MIVGVQNHLVIFKNKINLENYKIKAFSLVVPDFCTWKYFCYFNTTVSLPTM